MNPKPRVFIIIMIFLLMFYIPWRALFTTEVIKIKLIGERSCHELDNFYHNSHSINTQFSISNKAISTQVYKCYHDDVINWKHFPRYWPFVREIHRSPVNSPHKGRWCGALMFSLICVWINCWINNREAGDLRCHHAHYDVTVMQNCVAVIHTKL